MASTLVLAAHPRMQDSRVTARLMRAAARAGAEVGAEVRDLYALYPDYFVDVAAERAALAAARLVVWLHPIHWYGMPPLMKLWLDEVFGFGWAYGPGGTALRGKALWLVTSTGAPADSYRAGGVNGHGFDAYLLPYTQTAALTGLYWRPQLVLHGAHRADEAVLQAHEEAFTAGLQAHARAASDADAPACPEVAADTRPAAR